MPTCNYVTKAGSTRCKYCIILTCASIHIGSMSWNRKSAILGSGARCVYNSLFFLFSSFCINTWNLDEFFWLCGEKFSSAAPTNLVQIREPTVDDIIDFMDGISFPAECTNDCVKQNAMYCGYNYNTMVNNVFVCIWPQWEGVFFLQLTFLEVGQMEVWRHVLCVIWKVRLGSLRYALTRNSSEVVRHMVHLLGQLQRGQCNVFIMTCIITSSAFLIYTHLFGKRVSGVCANCKVHSLAAKNACQVTPHFAIWSSRRSCLRIISEPITLVTFKFRQYSCWSTFGLKAFKVTTKSLSFTSIQGTTTAWLTWMWVAVMAETMRLRVYCMTN